MGPGCYTITDLVYIIFAYNLLDLSRKLFMTTETGLNAMVVPAEDVRSTSL